MITFEPDSPWEVGDHVTFRNGPMTEEVVVTAVETDECGLVEYTFERADLADPLLPQCLRCGGVFVAYQGLIR